MSANTSGSEPDGRETGIHPTALVAAGAILGADVSIGPYSIIRDGVEIGEGTQVGSFCELGVPSAGASGPLVIGQRSCIRSHSVFYLSSRFGDDLVTGHRVTVREMTSGGEGLRIGTQADIQGMCTLGRHVRLHSGVFVAQHTEIGDFAWLFPHVVVTNDPHPPSHGVTGAKIGRFAAIAAGSVILPGISIGEGALVGAGSVVTKDIAAHRVAVGNPASDRGPTTDIRLRDGTNRPAYPWPSHFRRGYPDDLMEDFDQYLAGSRSP